MIAVNQFEAKPAIQRKLERLLKESRLLSLFNKNERVAVKMHFGEEGNTGFVDSDYLRTICAVLLQKETVPFLADTNTLYRGKRMNCAMHLELAAEHGFNPANIGVAVLIPDETEKENIAEVRVNSNLVKVARVARIFLEADAILGVAHFKGHMMTGFGGALKNIGMGCASRAGKLAQHSNISPYVIKKNCVGCGACETVCPTNAITIIDKKSKINNLLCIGCASCIASCQYNAMDVQWEVGKDDIQEKMVEYAFAVLRDKKRKSAFINFVLKITKECDCLAKDDPRIAPDIGILASADPLSLDRASLDLVVQACGKDIFKEVHPLRNGTKQLKHAFEIGLGNLEYELVKIT